MRPLSVLSAGSRSFRPRPLARACALLRPWLASCGMVPLPEQRVPDISIANSAGPFLPHQVAYMNSNQLEWLEVPLLPYPRVSVEAEVRYEGSSPVLHVQLYALNRRPECPALARRIL